VVTLTSRASRSEIITKQPTNPATCPQSASERRRKGTLQVMHFFWLCHKSIHSAGQRLRSLEKRFRFPWHFPPREDKRTHCPRASWGALPAYARLESATAALHIRTPRGTGSYCLLVTATRVPFQEFGYKSSPEVPLLRNTSNAILPCHKAGVGKQSVELFAFDRCVRRAVARW